MGYYRNTKNENELRATNIIWKIVLRIREKKTQDLPDTNEIVDLAFATE